MNDSERIVLEHRIGEQRREISRLRTMCDKIVFCQDCEHYMIVNSQAGFCLLKNTESTTADGFCSRGSKVKLMKKTGRLPMKTGALVEELQLIIDKWNRMEAQTGAGETERGELIDEFLHDLVSLRNMLDKEAEI